MIKRLATILLASIMCLGTVAAVSGMESSAYRVAISLDSRNLYAYNDFSEGYAVIQIGFATGSHNGIIDMHGNLIQSVRFYSGQPFSEGLAAGRGIPVAMGDSSGPWGFVDTSGALVIPFYHDAVTPFSEGRAAVGIRGTRHTGAFNMVVHEWGFIDRQGNIVIPHQFEAVTQFSNGLAAVAIRDEAASANRWGFIDLHGNIVIPFIYDNHEPVISEGLIAVQQDNRWGFIDTQGNVVIPFEFNTALPFSEGLAAVSRGSGINARWGFIDRHGNEVIPFEYESASSFSDGFAAVRMNGRIGFINVSGNLAIPFQYDNVHGGNRFVDGLASVSLNGAWGLINASGVIVAPFIYENPIYFSEGLAVVQRDGLMGYIDRSGNVVIPIKFYGSARNFFNGLASVWCMEYGRMFIALSNETPTATPQPSANPQPSSWAVEQVSAAISAGLVPQNLQSNYAQAITRAEFSALAVALYESINGEITGRVSFEDTTDINVEKAAAIGVVSGVGNNMFAPDTHLTREQAAVMLSRLTTVLGRPLASQPPTFADNSSISSWAIEGVGQIQAAGIMGGVGDNRFAPQDPYTREQSIVTIMRLR